MANFSDASPLPAWATGQRKVGPRRFRTEPGGLRFAFYGRISTSDHQDHGSSLHWQLTAATDLIVGYGRIVSEYFDAGVSRRTAWPDRPQAARLLAGIQATDRCFDAVVVGEFERACEFSLVTGPLIDRDVAESVNALLPSSCRVSQGV